MGILEGTTVAQCEYCGTKQTVPILNDERKANLYDRANHFRRNNEFDKAMNIYERILDDDSSDAEVYWSIVLCRYGVEYVEDPSTGKRVPTVNRTQFNSIFNDADYKATIAHADLYQKDIFFLPLHLYSPLQQDWYHRRINPSFHTSGKRILLYHPCLPFRWKHLLNEQAF